jgi:hypothetical protein
VSVERPVTRAGRTVVAAGAQRLDGAQALAYATQTHRDEPPMVAAGRMRQVLGALIAATPQTFSGARDLLGSLGVLGDAGVPVDRLAALLSGVARDAASGRLGSGALPIDRSSGGLDVAGGAPLVQDLLGGRPGTSLADTTPRVMVQLPEADSQLAAAVRAAVVGGGYEYVEGGIGPKRRSSAVLVRDPAATAVGEAVALTLGLPRSSVRTASDDVGDVPVVADVLVLLGYDAAI